MIRFLQNFILLFVIVIFTARPCYSEDVTGGAAEVQKGSFQNTGNNSLPGKGNDISPLICIDAVTSISGDIGEGGFDVRVQGGRWFMANLYDCGEAIAIIGRRWASKHKLQLMKDSVGKRRTVLHIGTHKLQGFFELLYRLRENPLEASVSLSFYNNAGIPVAPELSNFEGLELMSFAADLKEAIQCNP